MIVKSASKVVPISIKHCPGGRGRVMVSSVTRVMTQDPCPHRGGRGPVVSGPHSSDMVWRELPSLTLEAIKLFV